MAFGGFLRQSTAVDILIGPFLDETDGFTAETGLTITQAEIRLSKNSANIAQKNEATSLVHDELGYYVCKLNATDTDTVGQLTVIVHESGALPVRHEYQVMEEVPFDEMFASSATGVQGVIETNKLDHLVAVAESDDPVNNSIIGKLASTDGDWSNFATTDALQSIRDKLTDIETDTGTTLNDMIVSILRSSASLVTTVGATVTSATVFNLTAGVANNDAYNNMCITILDNSNGSLAETRKIVDYVGSTKTITVDRAFSFTPQASTDVAIVWGYTSNLNKAGGKSVTYTVTDDGTSGGNPIQDVHVWVTVDSAGNTIVASGDTDSSGEFTSFLDLGATYYFWKHKAGFTFESQPEEYLVV